MLPCPRRQRLDLHLRHVDIDAGADEVLTPLLDVAEQRARLDAMVVRSERSVAVHPSTRLPGTTEIERAIRRHLMGTEEFAVCYAGLDHFKEFNDRYSYYDGDRVILMVSRILHDVVKGIAGARGFVGHIGGDDFIFILPQSLIHEVCTEILHVFDNLVALQYNDQDRRSGYFSGRTAGASCTGAADDALHRDRHQQAPQVHAPGAAERAGHGNEELRQDAAGIGLRGRSPSARRAGGTGSGTARDR